MAISSVTLTPESIAEAADLVSDAHAIVELLAGDLDTTLDPEVLKARRAAWAVSRLLEQAQTILDEARG